jgi:hypothetical protein
MVSIQAAQRRLLKLLKKVFLILFIKIETGREKSSEILAYKAGISYSFVLYILKRRGLKAVKQTTKPGLTDEMKQK